MSQTAKQLNSPEQWVELYADEMYNFAIRRVNNNAVAEDLVQQALLGALKSKDSFKGNSSEKSWLFGILKYKCMDHLRVKNRERSSSELGKDAWSEDLFDKSGHWKQMPDDWSISPSSMMERAEFWTAFDQCFDKLPEKMGQAFALKVIDGEDSDSICDVLNITPSNLWALLHRSRMRLRECLENNWFAKEDNVDL